MKVTLIDYNRNAVDKLILCKQTRLDLSTAMEGVSAMSEEDKNKELHYIANTIKSSWEFLDYTFLIEGVSRAFTHQFVRNRQGSYAQQTMRMLDKADFEYVTGPSIATSIDLNTKYDDAMEAINEVYKDLIANGAAVEDARGILPTNICTNIIVKYNLRTLSELVASRSSPRTQGEFRDVMESMYEELVAVHPWLDIFLHDLKYKAAKQLDSLITSDYEGTSQFTHYMKQVDILRKG